MENENKTLNDYCFDFQQKFIDLFNNEQNLPFVLKYYLIKDIWENINSVKTKMDIETKNKLIAEQEIKTKTINFTIPPIEDEVNNEETEEM